jgi:hypothetical protein
MAPHRRRQQVVAVVGRRQGRSLFATSQLWHSQIDRPQQFSAYHSQSLPKYALDLIVCACVGRKQRKCLCYNLLFT